MATVNSVLGPLDTSDLGFTLSHEHILLSSAGIRHVYLEFIDRQRTIEEAVSHLSEARREGVGTLIDVTTLDLGRDVELVAEVSRRSGVNIICATGIWRDIPRAFWEADPDEIAALFVREIEVGIEGTGIRAGIIKVANDAGGVTPEGEIILRAAARAQKRTGVPISTHTWALERVGDEQVRIFEEEGVDLSRVYIGHSDDTTDLDYLTGLARKGVWLGLDRMRGAPLPGFLKWEERAGTTTKLIDAGFADRLMLGHDWSIHLGIIGKENERVFREFNPDGFLFITRHLLPSLMKMGVSQQTIDQIMVDNPRRFFEGS